MFSTTPKGYASRPLFQALRRFDSSIQCERCFDWLFLPRSGERLSEETKVLSALREHCRRTKITHARKSKCNCDTIYDDGAIKGISRRLELDFFLPKRNVAVEYDERQHFTKERRLTLEFYDLGNYPFDVDRWSSLCSDKIIDPDPPCRDWQRAFRDTVRDFRAREHGVRLIQLYYRDFDALILSQRQGIDRLAALIG
jgi:hypothetical protein